MFLHPFVRGFAEKEELKQKKGFSQSCRTKEKPFYNVIGIENNPIRQM